MCNYISYMLARSCAYPPWSIVPHDRPLSVLSDHVAHSSTERIKVVIDNLRIRRIKVCSLAYKCIGTNTPVKLELYDSESSDSYVKLISSYWLLNEEDLTSSLCKNQYHLTLLHFLFLITPSSKVMW